MINIMILDLSKPSRIVEWIDKEGNKHLIETYVYGNGSFISIKKVNGFKQD